MTGDLWLSRVEFDLRLRKVLDDAQTLHRIVVDAFPGCTGRQEAGALHHYTPPRAGQRPRLLVQSTVPPNWSALPAGRSTVEVKNIRGFWDRVTTDGRYRFRLTASPTRAVHDNGGDRTRGVRTPISDPVEQITWLARLLDDAATLTDVHVAAAVKITGRRGGHTIRYTSVTFSGVVTVTDPDSLRRHAIAGLGPGKAYGNGLLAISREPPPCTPMAQ